METDAALKILVVILSTTLGVFLIVGIVAIVKFIQILNSIKRITAKAEHIAEKAEAVTEFFQRSAAPIALGKLIANMAETVFRRKNRRQGGKENGEG